MYADILPATRLAVLKPQVFTYEVPAYWDNLKIGQVVEIPFRFRKVLGIVVGLKKTLPGNFKVKQFFRIVDPEPYFSKEHIELSKFLANYYFVSQGLVAKTMLPPFRKKGKSRKDPLPDININIKPSSVDKKVASKILKSAKKEYLVKQENSFGLILELVKKQSVDQERKNARTNNQVLILEPEINDCLILENYLRVNLKTTIATLHSDLSEGEYFENWQKIFKGEVKIIIGTRAAVFAPFKNLNLIIIDQEHDSSFKQWDMNPRYHARLAARELAKIKKSQLVMISANPSLETYYEAHQKKISYLESKPKAPCQTQIIDMREERKKGNFTDFSDALDERLEEIINPSTDSMSSPQAGSGSSKKQALIFINRKGSSGVVLCQDCGYLAKCPNCQVPLVYHEAGQKLLCHHCQREENVPLFCPNCRGPEIKFLGTGTEKIMAEIKKKWPAARVARLDLNIKNFKKNFWQILKDWQEKRIDILVGTQVLTKLPQSLKADLVALLNVDAMLHIPAWRQAETSWQLLHSVLQYGDSGLIQTYSPEHEVIQTVAKGDYQKFISSESKNREEFGYPPFGRLVKLIYKTQVKSELEKEAKKVAQKLKQAATPEIQVFGPLAPLLAKERNRFVAEILLKFNLKGFENKNGILKLVPKDWIVDVDPV